jgi:hypothetical protein
LVEVGSKDAELRWICKAEMEGNGEAEELQRPRRKGDEKISGRVGSERGCRSECLDGPMGTPHQMKSDVIRREVIIYGHMSEVFQRWYASLAKVR